MLKLRRAKVVSVGEASAPEQSLLVELAQAPGEHREAIADVGLVGPAQVGDELIVNVEALDLGLGSGGFDVVHVNLSRGLTGEGGGGHARDEAQLHEPAARRGAGRGRGRLAAARASRRGARAAWSARGARVGVRAKRAGRQARLRADRRRRVAGGPFAHGARAPRARPARRPLDGGAIVRRRARGDHERGSAASRPAHAGLGRGCVRTRAGHRRLRLGARPRRHGGARFGALGARAGRADAARRAHVLGRRARHAIAASHTTR